MSTFIDLGMECESVFCWTKIHCQNAETLILKLFVTLNLILAPNTLTWMVKRLREPVDLSVDFEHLFMMYILLILVLCQILCLILYQFTLTLFQNKQINASYTTCYIVNFQINGNKKKWWHKVLYYTYFSNEEILHQNMIIYLVMIIYTVI